MGNFREHAREIALIKAFLAQNAANIVQRPGSARSPGPARGAYSAPQTPYLD